jgi:hypothetical protein
MSRRQLKDPQRSPNFAIQFYGVWGGSALSFPVNDRNQNTSTPYGAPVYDINGNMTRRGDHRFV